MTNKAFEELQRGDVIAAKLVVACRIEKGFLVSVVDKTTIGSYLYITEKSYIKYIEPRPIVGSQFKCNDGSTWQLINAYKNELYLFEVGNEERTILVKANMLKIWERIK